MRIALRGPAGEPVDLRRSVHSHGCASLPPMQPDADGLGFAATVRVAGVPTTVRVRAAGQDAVEVEPGDAAAVAVVRTMLRLDEDLAGFYAVAADDPDLAWVTAGAGRMLRAQTVFQDVVTTLCTTNCAWSATERMVGAIVGHLGDPVPGGTARAFPTPDAMAAAGEAFYRDVVRAGYRARYLVELSRAVADGQVDLDALADPAIDDGTVADRLLSLAGIGGYATAHIMLMLGRYRRLILDSWTRPTYARLARRRSVSDNAIRRRFARYGDWAGLAFWCKLTRDWVED
jgi:3-methyladenine DNA glycosylase/8-oxoguanine DNA glycosylase